MPLSAGTHLGPYEIIERIGAGGMGEVYKARDTRLGRTVAVKVAAAQFGDRFEREARAVAALNHPNIVAIYDVGDNYIVSEFVDGVSLRGASWPLGKTIEVAAQIAEGLAAAHAAGFSHRDLKPENIMVTREGRAKILDFGLAKDVRRAPAGTEDTTRTLEGVIMGTVGYMSPEQVRGQEADHRSDIFSFGVVLYEMLAEQRAFAADTAAETMTAILKSDPVELPATVPAGLRDVVKHCLEKDPGHRFQSAKDLAFALRMLGGTGSTAAVPLASPVITRRWAAIAAVGVVPLVAGLVGGILLADRPFVDTSHIRFTPMAVEGRANTYPSWAPDGRSFVYHLMERIAKPLLMIRSLDSPVANQIGPGGVRGRGYAVYSKDHTRLYYTDTSDDLHRELWTVALAGGNPERLFGDLGGLPIMDGLALTPDGGGLAIIREESNGQLTLWISSPPGAPLQRTALPGYHVSAARARLRFSPDGRKLLTSFFTDHVEYFLSPWPADGRVRRIFATFESRAMESGAGWLADNRHLLMTGSPSATQLNGSLYVADTVTEHIYPLDTGHEGFQTPAVSSDGKALVSTFETDSDIVDLPLDGSAPRDVVVTSRGESFPDRSRVGDQLVYVTDRSGSAEIWIRSNGGDWQRPLVTQSMFPDGPAVFKAPVFSPDGRRIAFTVSGNIWVVPAAGGVPTRAGAGGYPSWSPDGEWLAFLGQGADGKTILQKRRLGSASPPVDLHDMADTIRPMWSADGRWITLLLPEGLGVTSPDGKLTKVLVRRSLGPFTSTGWSLDGKILYLADAQNYRLTLTAIDPERGNERSIAEYTDANFNLGERFNRAAGLSPTPDGRSLTAARRRQHGDIWLIEGIEPPRTFWQRLFRR